MYSIVYVRLTVINKTKNTVLSCMYASVRIYLYSLQYRAAASFPSLGSPRVHIYRNMIIGNSRRVIVVVVVAVAVVVVVRYSINNSTPVSCRSRASTSTAACVHHRHRDAMEKAA